MNLQVNGETSVYNKSISKQLNDYPNEGQIKFAKVDFGDEKFVRDFLTFTNILLNDHVDNHIQKDSKSGFKPYQLLNGKAINSLSPALASYNKNLSDNIQQSVVQSVNDAGLRSNMSALDDIDRRTGNHA